MKKKAMPPTDETAAIPLEWHVPEGQITPFATHMVVQTIGNEFKISFFEVKPPIQLDDSESSPSKVRADQIASVIVTADRLPSFIKVLQRQLIVQDSRSKE